MNANKKGVTTLEALPTTPANGKAAKAAAKAAAVAEKYGVIPIDEYKSKGRPAERCRLFGDIALKDRVCALYGAAGIGKSTLAVQAALQIASGTTGGEYFENDFEGEAKRVLYISGEMTSTDFAERYNGALPKSLYILPLFDAGRVKIDIESAPAEDIKKAVEDAAAPLDLLSCLIEVIPMYKIEVVVIDNLTCVVRKVDDPDKTAEFMAQIMQLKKAYNISVLVVAHTQKDISKVTCFEMANLRGSGMMQNYMEQMSVIAKSLVDKKTIYLKTTKSRSRKCRLHAENVLCIDMQPNTDFAGCNGLFFAPVETCTERELMINARQLEGNELIKLAHTYSDEGLSQKEIGKLIGKSQGTVSKILKKPVIDD